MTEIPKIMRTMERDRRGYPIPFIVLRDAKGGAHFSVNDVRRVITVTNKRLCSICGRKLLPQVWFVGGTRCFTSDRGAFLDPPVHYECGLFALRVCPFLASPRYAKSVGQGKLRDVDVPEALRLITIDYTGPMRPERFGFGATHRFRVHGSFTSSFTYQPLEWDYVEFWRDGAPIEAPDAATIAELDRIA